MAIRILLAAAGLCLAATAAATAATAVVPSPPPAVFGFSPAIAAQHTSDRRAFRRCMRAKYGPRYFAGVRRAHRWHMSQACMA